MVIGAGKYDDACEMVRMITGGNVVVIVIGGRQGSGFSAQFYQRDLIKLMPDMLEEMAAEIRRDLEAEKTLD